MTKKIGDGLSGRSDQVDSVAWFAVRGASAVQAHHEALPARAATIFNGVPVGDVPPLIPARHLGAELAVS